MIVHLQDRTLAIVKHAILIVTLPNGALTSNCLALRYPLGINGHRPPRHNVHRHHGNLAPTSPLLLLQNHLLGSWIGSISPYHNRLEQSLNSYSIWRLWGHCDSQRHGSSNHTYWFHLCFNTLSLNNDLCIPATTTKINFHISILWLTVSLYNSYQLLFMWKNLRMGAILL